MALTIMNNPTAIGAMGKLNSSNAALSKTIGQLSSGLRINSAADDASGLAVSEKLRGQIKGLSKAASNAQDAISLLQTAEASMGSMTDIIQRMRELAVQAGDPAYTTNDRAMLQLEVDQLKSEVNRISTSTEFNTKKLLNGDAAGVWSSSSANLEALIKGSPAEGNYNINATLAGGTNFQYKSSLMNVSGDPLMVTTGGDAIDGLRSIKGLTSGSVTVTIPANTTATVATLLTGGANTLTAGGITGAGTYYVEITQLTGDTNTGTATIKVINALTGTSETKTVNITSAALTATISINGLTFNTAAGTINLGTTLDTKSVLQYNRATATDGSSVTIRFTGTGTYASTAGITINGAVNAGAPSTHSLMLYKTGTVDAFTTISMTLDPAEAMKGISSTPFRTTNLATANTRLDRLTNFVNSDGRNVLSNTQQLSIYGGNGKSATINIEGSDTIADLQNKLATAIVDQLGMGDASIKDSLVNYIEPRKTKAGDQVEGTFVIQTGLLGKSSALSFVGDQNVLNALGVTSIQQGNDASLSVAVSDAHTGAAIGGDTITDGVLRGLIKGVDVKLDPTDFVNVTADANGKLTFSGKTDDFTLHIKDNATKAAIGPNEGQTLDISIGRVDTLALGIDNVVVATFDEAQSSISKLDLALETLSKSRATAGAQMNRLDYTINNLNVMRENLTSAESRLRDLDMAQASSDLTAQQVRLQAATAMLAQANQMPSYAAQLLQ